MSLARWKSIEHLKRNEAKDAEEREKVHRVSSLTVDELPDSKPNIGAPVIVTDAVRAAYASFFAYGCF